MVSIGSQKIAEETYRDSIQENVFKSSSSIQLNATGPLLLPGPPVLSLRMNPAGFSKSSTTRKTQAKNGTTSQTTSSISNGASRRWPRTTPCKSQTIESGSLVMTLTLSIRATARRSHGPPTLICTCLTTTLQHPR